MKIFLGLLFFLIFAAFSLKAQIYFAANTKYICKLHFGLQDDECTKYTQKSTFILSQYHEKITHVIANQRILYKVIGKEREITSEGAIYTYAVENPYGEKFLIIFNISSNGGETQVMFIATNEMNKKHIFIIDNMWSDN